MKVKNIVVKPSSDYVIWSENLTDIVRDTKLNVDAGCLALYIVNGNLKSINTPGRWLINSKEEDKSNSTLQLIGVNTDKTFDILCGVGGIPFKDLDLNIETTVGAHGECKIRINQPWLLYTTIGHSNITAEEINDYVRLKMNEIMTTRLSEVLQRYDYDNIMTQQSKIASDLSNLFSIRMNEIGILVDSFALAGINFSKEYLDKRKAYFDEENRRKREKEDRRAAERAQRAEIDNVISLANATRDLSSQGNQTVNNYYNNMGPSGNNQTVAYCPKCGTKLAPGTAFCPSCGKKI